MNKDIPLKDMLPAEIERVLDAYYYAAKKCYLIPKEGEGWVEVNAAALRRNVQRVRVLPEVFERGLVSSFVLCVR